MKAMPRKSDLRVAAERLKREEKEKLEREKKLNRAFKVAVEIGANKLGVPEYKVAEMLGIYPSRLCYWKSNPSSVSIEHVRQLKDLFEWDADTVNSFIGAEPRENLAVQEFMQQFLQAVGNSGAGSK